MHRWGAEQAVRGVLRSLLERGVVDALLVPVEVAGGLLLPRRWCGRQACWREPFP